MAISWDEIKRARQRLSREQGAITRDWGGKIPVALIYPNSYYLGMSNLGIHAIYGLLNSYEGIVCERAFWEKGDVVSVESQRPLSDFAVLAFSVSYELDYFNVAQVLKKSGLPLYAADRDETQPLVIAGGPCLTANPAPLAPFFDCLGIGEAEAILPTMLPVIADGLTGRRDDLLTALAALPGVYVPSHSATPVARQWAGNLDSFPVGSVILTPDTELGNLYLIEVERGCNWGCRFCLVSRAFCPMRYRSLDNLLAQARTGLKYRQRLGLVGAAVTDHPQIEELMAGLGRMGAGLAVSSLRIKPLSRAVLGELARGGGQTIALAPEAGSERLRRVIRKGISEEDILEAVAEAAGQGIKNIKLYFMLGLPTETDEDADEIISLALRCKDILDKKRGGGRLSLNIAPFVPKAGTPFQCLPMAPLPVLKHRLSRIKRELAPRGITVKSESIPWSQVQAVLARGGSELAGVLADTEETSLSGWRRAATGRHVDIDFYAHRRWGPDQKLPWAAVDLGVTTDKLEPELADGIGPTEKP
ncbi:radical SAM protein [Chloroflexota bacterium]